MAKRKKAVQAIEGSAALNEVQTIVRRLVEDEELREGLGQAIESSRRVYDRVSATKKPAKLLEDKKLQEDAIDAFDAIRSVTIALTGVGKSIPSPKALKKQRKKGGGFGKLVVLLGLGGAAAVAASDDLRSKVLDTLFGAEEEFQYSPPPPPAATDSPGTPLSAV